MPKKKAPKKATPNKPKLTETEKAIKASSKRVSNEKLLTQIVQGKVDV